jgi:thiamine transporter
VKLRAKILTEVIVFTALAGVLYEITFYQFPNGGRITAASMVPILFIALRRGPKVGIAAGIVFGLVALVLDAFAFVVNPVQVLLDYPLAFGALGLAGFFRKNAIVGVAVGIAGRFLCHFVSGLLFFAMYAPQGEAPALYSAIYNASYLIPELFISAIVLFVLQKRGIIQLYQ